LGAVLSRHDKFLTVRTSNSPIDLYEFT